MGDAWSAVRTRFVTWVGLLLRRRRRAAAAATQRWPDLLPWLLPAMLALTALDVLGSGRNLTETYAQLQRSAEAAAPLMERGALQIWAQRALSLLLIAATLQRIVPHVACGRPAPAPVLSVAFLVYWAASIAAPGLLGAHPRVSHEYAYPLLLGLALTLVGPRESRRMLRLLRDALFASMAAGLPLLALQRGLVLDSGYDQGWIPGLPRYGGLANSPVMMGLLAQLALLLLWTHPYRRRWLYRTAWALGLAILLVAQSKAAWLSFLVGGACLLGAQGRLQQVLGDPRRTTAAIGLCLCLILVALATLVGTVVMDLPGRIAAFLGTSDGAQLTSLTGRDRIWLVAMDEWRDHPLFGYGLPIWNSEYRHEVGLPQATHAHNQVVDTLGRAGLVGVAGLAVYAAVLFGLCLRHARAGGGLGLAMGATLALQCVTEVPMLLIDYGSHLLTHYVMVICVAAAVTSPAPTRKRPLARTDPFVPVHKVDWRVEWGLPGWARPARKAVLASGVPFLLAVGSPLADGVPDEIDRIGAMAVAATPAPADPPAYPPGGQRLETRRGR